MLLHATAESKRKHDKEDREKVREKREKKKEEKQCLMLLANKFKKKIKGHTYYLAQKI